MLCIVDKCNLLFVCRTASVVSSVDCGPIVLGPVIDLLLLRDLRNVTVSAVCSRVHIENCQHIQLFVNCETAPVVGENCREVYFGPYNVFYDVRLQMTSTTNCLGPLL